MTCERKLTAEKVRSVASFCQLADNEAAGTTCVDAIVNKYAFHRGRLEASKPQIADLLSGLSDDFMSDGGGGMSFLNACVDRDGVHWGEHPTMELLFALGMGAGMASYLLPRDIWPALPGGVPYMLVDSTALSDAGRISPLTA